MRSNLDRSKTAPVLAKDDFGQIGVVLFVVVPRNLPMVREELGPPHLRVRPLPATKNARQSNQHCTMILFASFAVLSPHSPLQKFQVHLLEEEDAAILVDAAAVHPDALLGNDASLELALQVHFARLSVRH